DAEGGAVELLALFMRGVESMISGYTVHGAVGQAGEQGFPIGAAAQRRGPLVICGGGVYVFIQQNGVMRRDLAGHAQMIVFGAAYRAQCAGRREMSNVVAGLGFGGQADVALYDGTFRFGGPAAQAQAKGSWP